MDSISTRVTAPASAPVVATAAPPLRAGHLAGPPEAVGAPQAEGDHALAMAYHDALLQSASNEKNVRIAIPPHSTFGQWWRQLRDAFQSDDIRQWLEDKGISRSSITLDPASGQLTFKLKRRFDPEQSLHTVGLDDHRWRAISGPILEAARVIDAATSFAPPATELDEPVPWRLVGRFYQEPQELTQNGKRSRAQTILRHQDFDPLDAGAHAGLIESRSEASLQDQKAALGDIYNRHVAASTLRHIAASLEKNGFEYGGQLRESLEQTIHLSAEANYRPGTTGQWSEVSLLRYLADHGWDIPTEHEHLLNLANALSTPAPQSPETGDLSGALGWPIPLTAHIQAQLSTHVRTGKFGDVTLRPFENVLDYLLDGRPVTPEEARAPRQLIDSLLHSPRGKALGEAIAATFEARAVKGSALDWLLAALHTDSGAAGDYPLVSVDNADKSPTLVTQALTEHLAGQRKGSSVETAAIRAHLLLAHQAPQFLVKDIPEPITVGTHSWVSFTTAVARIEAKAPGATATMSYAEVMLAASIAPVTEDEHQIEYTAQQEALKDWAVANGMLYPTTEPALAQVRDVFNAQISELRHAAETPIGELPTTDAIALEQLKNALPDIPATLLEKKCISVQPSNRHFPGPYSILDLYIDGRGLRGAPDSADNWGEAGRTVVNVVTLGQVALPEDGASGTLVSASDAFNLNDVLARIKDLPRPQDAFEGAFANYADAVKLTTAAQIKFLVSNLPREDRENLEFGKITVRREMNYHRNDHPQPEQEGTVLVETLRNGHSITYAINRLKGSITKLPLKTYREYPPRESLYASKGKRYDPVQPAGEYPPGITDERTLTQGLFSFGSARTRYLADAVIEDINLPALHTYAKGATTFDTEVPTYQIVGDIALNLIPFRSAIKHFQNGKIGDGIADLAFDIFGFAVGLGVAAKGVKVLAAGASALSKAGRGFKIIGRAAVGALNPLSGVGDLAHGILNLGRRGLSGLKRLPAKLSRIDTIALARQPNMAQGLLKGANAGDKVNLLAKRDELTGHWHAIHPTSRQPYGPALGDFQVQALSRGELSENLSTLYKRLDKAPQLDICYATALRTAQADRQITDTAFRKIIPEVLDGGTERYNQIMNIGPDTLKSAFNAADISESGIVTFVGRRGYNKDKIVHAVYIQKASDGQLHLYHSNSHALDHALGGTKVLPETAGRANVYTFGAEQQAGVQQFMDSGAGFDMVFTPSSTLESSIRNVPA